MAQISRTAVYWFGKEPTPEEEREFQNRDLTVRRVGSDNDYLNFEVACAAVFSCKPPHVPEVCGRLKCARDALDAGLMLALLADDATTQAHLDKYLPLPFPEELQRAVIRKTGTFAAHDLAQSIAKHDPKPPPRPTLDIALAADITLNPNERFFLTRAFSDCRRIALRRLPGGLSANTFFVQATLTFSEAGPRPMPFFVKLDDPVKISRELNNYQRFATNHIPWNLRPNLELHRCIIGVEQGILVGSFVDRSESLWEVAQKGNGARYIHTLFENTLMGWRSHADSLPMASGKLADALSDVFDYKRVLPKYIEAARQRGLDKPPEEIWLSLLNLEGQYWREATMHGDMHGENVRVRDSDAIVIDLAKTRSKGPLSADLASLDVWLSFKLPSDSQEFPKREEWTAVVDDLYKPEHVSQMPRTENVDVGIDWLRSCIRQVRMISSATCECPTEYATAIALYLLRRATREQEFLNDGTRHSEDEYRRGYAYFLGAKIVDWLTTQPNDAKGAR